MAEPPQYPILMYHSISDGRGPTALPPSVFKAQLAVLADLDYRAVPLGRLVAALRGEGAVPRRCCAITFDDAFQDFADEACGALEEHGFAATVFVPVASVGGAAQWKGMAGRPESSIMSWDTMRELSSPRVQFGSHGMSHRALDRLPEDELRAELVDSKSVIEHELGVPASLLAMPYGRTNERVRALARQSYRAAVGTRLELAEPGSDLFDLPRLEMWYFRDPDRWWQFLTGKAEAWFKRRQRLRRLRTAVAPS